MGYSGAEVLCAYVPGPKGPVFMGLLERTFGANITTRTLDTVLAARPDRLAVYSYAHLPAMFKAQRQIAEADLPDNETKLGLLALTIEKLSGSTLARTRILGRVRIGSPVHGHQILLHRAGRAGFGFSDGA